MKTNWQDPGTTEILSSHISGLQEAVGKIEDSIGLQTTAETTIALTEVYIQPLDRYRIYQAAEGKRNWVASPAPVIYKNSVEITTGFAIDYGGGAIILSNPALSTDVFTADFTRTNSTHAITPASIGAESKADADSHKADYVSHPAVATTTNSGNVYSVTLNPVPTSYVNGMGLILTINADSTGEVSIKVNDLVTVPIKKANGNAVTNLKANGVYTLRYSTVQSAFILQGEGGSGNLQPNQALAGFTFTNDEGEQIGAGDTNLIADNIKKGVSIFGVLGNAITALDKASGILQNNGSLAYDASVTKTITTGFRPNLIILYHLPPNASESVLSNYANRWAIIATPHLADNKSSWFDTITQSNNSFSSIWIPTKGAQKENVGQTVGNDVEVNVDADGLKGTYFRVLCINKHWQNTLTIGDIKWWAFRLG